MAKVPSSSHSRRVVGYPGIKNKVLLDAEVQLTGDSESHIIDKALSNYYSTMAADQLKRIKERAYSKNTY